MTELGLKEVLNPSEVFLSQRNYGSSGCVISASLEGTRPILIEVQALVTSSNYGIPQRTSTGFDYKKLKAFLKKNKIEANETNLQEFTTEGKKEYRWVVTTSCPDIKCRVLQISADKGKILADIQP